MKITYIYHSGFCIETENTAVIIDFYKDTKDVDGYIYDHVLKSGKKIYVLVTHSHLDHFNGEILNWKSKVKDITYIFSEDVLLANIAKKSEATFLAKFQEYKDDIIYIKAYGSTDVGGSLYIEMDKKKLFHAGDLNNWHWNQESAKEEVEEAENNYAKELATLAKEVKQLDFAMFPLDNKLGKDFMKGAQQFVEAIEVKKLAPMHFDNHIEEIVAFEPIAKANGCNYIMLIENGQSIDI